MTPFIFNSVECLFTSEVTVLMSFCVKLSFEGNNRWAKKSRCITFFFFFELHFHVFTVWIFIKLYKSSWEKQCRVFSNYSDTACRTYQFCLNKFIVLHVILNVLQGWLRGAATKFGFIIAVLSLSLISFFPCCDYCIWRSLFLLPRWCIF